MDSVGGGRSWSGGRSSSILHFLASPFVLFFLWYYLGGEVAGLGNTLRRQQNYRRMLEAAAVNPHDGEAQYQLGLISSSGVSIRRPSSVYKNAVAIDPHADRRAFSVRPHRARAGPAARRARTFPDRDRSGRATQRQRDPARTGRHLRQARQFKDARNELAAYVERRPYDPEGLFPTGQTMEGLGQMAEARELYARAVEAERTAPRYRRRFTAKWSRLAQKALEK